MELNVRQRSVPLYESRLEGISVLSTPLATFAPVFYRISVTTFIARREY
ncbi:hypothetical protein PN498_17565 [Oscillatoria sp. CS-180]|nr:hypothetical protein [Oscillatoria sp. CS-180]MDB9527807.1 hypothetical protein [Oscillatoria sp. CS-180]